MANKHFEITSLQTFQELLLEEVSFIQGGFDSDWASYVPRSIRPEFGRPEFGRPEFIRPTLNRPEFDRPEFIRSEFFHSSSTNERVRQTSFFITSI